MKLFRKATATVALVTLLSGIFSAGVSAYSTEQYEAANYLAAENVINAQVSAADYNLDQNVLRQEIAKVAANMADLEMATTCEGSFSDVSSTTPNTWACGYVEALLEEGLVSANAKFNPETNISKSEAVKLMLAAAGYTDTYSNVATWQQEVVAFAVENALVSTFADYNTPATRGFVFEIAANAMVSNEAEDDLGGLEDIIDLIGWLDDEDDTETDTDTDTTPVVSGDNVLEVTLSPETADSATVPGNISGLPVASFDFTAGSEDVTVSALTIKRKGLSDKDTLTALAVFSDEGRASKSKNDSQENDTEATLALSDGGVVVKAGETRTLIVVADIAATADANGDEFAIELIEVVASSTVEGVDNLLANTMKVGGVDAAQVTVEKGSSVADVKVGEEAVEIFKFDIKGDNDSDVILKSITFKGEGTSDEEDDLANFSLEFDGDVVATTAFANGKYVTFNLEDGITIEEDKTEQFTVLADINAGVNKTIEFKIDKTLDVTAEGVKYGFGASVNIDDVDSSIDVVEIDAGELTLSDMDAPADKIRADKTNVELGSIKVTNVSGDNLELQKLGVDVTLSAGTLAETFENFEAVINGTSYELEVTASESTTANGVFADTDLDIILEQGVTSIVFQADTKEDVVADVTVDLVMDDLDTQFYVIETEDDTQVDDITPSTLSFKKLTFIDSGATASSVSLADVTVVRGAEGIVAAQFEVEAEEASLVEIDEITVNVAADTAFNTTDRQANKFVSEVALYKGSVSESNKLDTVSGTKIATDGTVIFNGFKTTVAADGTETFIVTVTIVDGSDPVGETITVSVTGISADDDENDDVTVAGLNLVSNKDIDVSESGSFTIAYDSNNDDNEEVKTALAGESLSVVSYDVQAKNEAVDVETVKFTLSDTTSKTKETIESAKLYLDDTLVATTLSKDILAPTATTDEDSTITVTNEATSAGNVTVTLDGTANVIPVSYSAAADAEETTLTVSTAPVFAGNIQVNINGATVSAAVLSTDSAIVAAGKIAAAIWGTATDNGDATISVVAAADGAQTDAIVNLGWTNAVVDVNVTTQGADAATTITSTAAEISSAINALSNYSSSSALGVITVLGSTWAEADATFAAGTTGVVASVTTDVDGKDGSGSANTTITFDNLSNLIIDTEDVELRLDLVTSNIGFEEVGNNLSWITVVNVALTDAEGVDSGKSIATIAAHSDATTSKGFSVAAATVIASVTTDFSDSNTAIFDLNVTNGNNKQEDSNSDPVVTIESLTFTEEGNIAAADYTLKDEDGGILKTGVAAAGWVVEFTGLSIDITDVETLKIEAEVSDASIDTYGLTLKKDGISYVIDGGATTIFNNASDTTSFGAKN